MSHSVRKLTLLTAAMAFAASLTSPAYAAPGQCRRAGDPYGDPVDFQPSAPSQPKRQGKPWARKKANRR